VARLAGVGIATVFRHFPAKADLLDEVLARRFQRLRERAGRLAGSADPGRALFGMITELYALLIGMSRAAACAQLDPGVRARALRVVFDGLAGR
jgi:AcrR family transcriptional regulator